MDSDSTIVANGAHFLKLAIVLIISLLISPLLFKAISAANSTGKVTGSLSTVVNLVPTFYYLSVAIIAAVDIWVHLKEK